MSVSEGGSISIMPVGGCLRVNASPNTPALRLVDAGSDGAGDGDGPEQPEGGQALPRDYELIDRDVRSSNVRTLAPLSLQSPFSIKKPVTWPRTIDGE